MHLHLAYTLPIVLLQATLSISQESCSPQTGIQLTNYGFPDASGLTQFGCSSGQPNSQENIPTPLGDGSHDRPFSAASGTGSTLFPGCSLVYIPYFKKYFRFVDNCGACGSAPDSHIDLYLVQSNSDIGQSSCEQAFGNFGGVGHVVITSPGSDLPYESAPLFSSGTCYNDPSQGRVFPDNNDTGCGGGGGGASNNSSTSSTNDEGVPSSAAAATPDGGGGGGGGGGGPASPTDVTPPSTLGLQEQQQPTPTTMAPQAPQVVDLSGEGWEGEQQFRGRRRGGGGRIRRDSKW